MPGVLKSKCQKDHNWPTGIWLAKLHGWMANCEYNDIVLDACEL